MALNRGFRGWCEFRDIKQPELQFRARLSEGIFEVKTDRPQANQPEHDSTFREPDRPRFSRSGAVDESLPELVKSCLLELSGEELTTNWRKCPEIDEYEIGWPEGKVRPVRLPNGQTLWLVFDLNGIEVLHNHYSQTDLAILGMLRVYEANEANHLATVSLTAQWWHRRVVIIARA